VSFDFTFPNPVIGNLAHLLPSIFLICHFSQLFLSLYIILSMVMKKTIFLFIAVILLLSCCTRGRYSARLVAADSLMNAHPDSAYAILKSISSDTLPSKADRAYYALLFTQAMYKNYDTIRSDSLINIAVNFFSDNHDRAPHYKNVVSFGDTVDSKAKVIEKRINGAELIKTEIFTTKQKQ
jgi:hypothetical protein